ncbi:NAD(P)-dependent oxidoreductase [Nocardia sp. CWNU-33]|uniref:NAD(P)-dependent oxidoreductase n=1 Tax=Nocardia sp. CWNU-33 TaxID=3392117 RepID=UPI00398F4FE4
MRIIVFGANGPTGRLLTAQALDAGHDVVAVTRRPAEFPIAHERLVVFGGDVHQLESVDTAIAGADAVLSALGVPYGKGAITTYSTGVGNIVAAMHRHGVRRIGVVSSSAVDPKPYSDAGFLFNRVLQPYIVRVMGKTLYDDMRRMETLLRASDLEWTIVRPGGLYELPAVTDYTMVEGHVDSRYTARIDLAASLLRLVGDDRFVRKIVGVVTTTDNPSLLQLIRKEALGKS